MCRWVHGIWPRAEYLLASFASALFSLLVACPTEAVPCLAIAATCRRRCRNSLSRTTHLRCCRSLGRPRVLSRSCCHGHAHVAYIWRLACRSAWRWALVHWSWHWGASQKKRRRRRNFGDACGAMLLLGAGSRACALLGARCVGHVGVKLPDWLAGARSVAGRSGWHPGVLFRSHVFIERLPQARRSKLPERASLFIFFAMLSCACGHAAVLGPTLLL